MAGEIMHMSGSDNVRKLERTNTKQRVNANGQQKGMGKK